MSNEAPAGPDAAIEAWRQRGDHRFDPVRFHFIEALARRAALHEGAARRLLDERLQTHMAAYAEALQKSRETSGAAPNDEPPPTGRSALAELVEHLGQHASALSAATAASPVPSGELKTLSYFRSTWSRLSADRRLHQSLAKVPENAGPLNSHHLVHRALTLMRDLSPEYLNKFMSYVDGLLWLADADARGPAAASAQGAETGRKSGRGKAR
ncbi:DUF2894 domain-containing protein [Variovorax sp. YR216]|uniref:DUF2894 domain-containing protein n=1 Tax=Variovorax sp. YR216 TaxID=1882828 RepID=UPI000895056A|nr:DUF2894 domain-containing protein [Variovorax sp. YR216]SEB16101.1 Protein of unknown function [Variovorax sp. YR216]